MKRIRIAVVPEGFISLCFREALVGLELTLVPDEDFLRVPFTQFDTSFSTDAEGYVVLRSSVVDALDDAGRDVAREFWDTMSIGKYMVFSTATCVLIETTA